MYQGQTTTVNNESSLMLNINSFNKNKHALRNIMKIISSGDMPVCTVDPPLDHDWSCELKWAVI